MLLSPRPAIRDPERRLPLRGALEIALPFIKPSLANASWKLWAPVGPSDSSQAAHYLCPYPGRHQQKECRLGQWRSASFGLGHGRWAGSQYSVPVLGNLAGAGQESTVGLPCSGAICGSLVSFTEKHPYRRVWRGSCYTPSLCSTLGDPLKCPGAQMSWSRHSSGPEPRKGQPC